MRQGILLGNLLCDRVQDVERFATHPRHFLSEVPAFCLDRGRVNYLHYILEVGGLMHSRLALCEKA